MKSETLADNYWMSKLEREKLSGTLAARLTSARGIKPFSQVVQKTLELLRSKDHSIREVAEAFGGDPALASHVLRLANSALYSRTASIKSVEQAVIHLGSKTVEELLVSAAVAGMFNDATGTGSFYRDHCAGTAAVARVLAEKLSPDHLEDIFLCGLMHDLGKLILLQAGQTLYKNTLDATDMRTPDRIHLEEQDRLGYDHALFGGFVLQQWKIPEPIPTVVALHHKPQKAFQIDRVGPMVALLRIGDRIESQVAFGLPDPGLGKSEEYRLLGIEEPYLRDFTNDLATAREETLTLIKSLR